MAKPERSKPNNKRVQRSKAQGPVSAISGYGFVPDERPLCPVRDVPYVESLYEYKWRDGEYNDRSMRARGSRAERIRARWDPRVDDEQS